MAAFPEFLTRSRRMLAVSLTGGLITLLILVVVSSLHRNATPGEMAGFMAGAILTGMLGGLLFARFFLQSVSGADALVHAVSMAPGSTGLDTAGKSVMAGVPASSAGAAPAARNQEQEIRASEQRFRELAESVGAVFWMTDGDRSRMIYVSSGYEKIWGRTCDSLYANAREWFEAVHPEDRERVRGAALTKQSAGDYDEEYRILRPDGSLRWVRDRAFPVRSDSSGVERIAGIAEDITERKRLEKEVVEISDREQRRLGQDLHDGICQQLVSIAFAADLLRRDLVAKLPHEAVRLARITALLDNAILQARHLSHALYPVNLVGNGLGFALRELASSISQGYHVDCEAQCAEAVLIRDHAVATHLYRIAQEAVQNATKHADPSRILICLAQDGDTVHLNVTDNGVGIGDERNFGVGVSIMRYRANMAGGQLQIQRGPFGGTMVSVSVQMKAASPRLSHETVPENPVGQPASDPPPAGGGDKIIPCTFPQSQPYYPQKKGDTEQRADV